MHFLRIRNNGYMGQLGSVASYRPVGESLEISNIQGLGTVLEISNMFPTLVSDPNFSPQQQACWLT